MDILGLIFNHRGVDLTPAQSEYTSQERKQRNTAKKLVHVNEV